MEVEKLVLLVEDNEINAEIVRQQLTNFGFGVEWVRDGAKAVETFKESDEDHFDLIIMDLMMPVMDGVEATKNIRELDRADAGRIPIVAITANSYSEDEDSVKESGITRCLTKPYCKDTLYETIKELTETEA